MTVEDAHAELVSLWELADGETPLPDDMETLYSLLGAHDPDARQVVDLALRRFWGKAFVGWVPRCVTASAEMDRDYELAKRERTT